MRLLSASQTPVLKNQHSRGAFACVLLDIATPRLKQETGCLLCRTVRSSGPPSSALAHSLQRAQAEKGSQQLMQQVPVAAQGMCRRQLRQPSLLLAACTA